MIRVVWSFVLILSVSGTAHAGIIFREIAHSSDGYAGARFEVAFATPSLNNLGQVAFRGRRFDGTIGIYVGTETTLSVIADSTGSFPGIGIGVPGINDSGDVVFLSNIPRPPGNSGTRRIVVGNLSTPTNTLSEVVKRGDPLPGIGAFALGSGDLAPAINNDGTVSVAQQTIIGGVGAYIFDGISATEIAPPSVAAFGGTAINSSGLVALTADVGREVYVGDGSTLTKIADGVSFDTPDLNDSGHTLFYAGGVTGVGGRGIYLHDGTSLSQVLGNTSQYHFEFGPFESLFPGINNHGRIAGIANVFLPTGGASRTLFVDDPLTGRVIGTGDVLFGRQLSHFNFYKGINDRDQLAFHALFTDGTEGIYLAEMGSAAVPEPSSWAIMMVGFMVGLLVVGVNKCRSRASDGHVH